MENLNHQKWGVGAHTEMGANLGQYSMNKLLLEIVYCTYTVRSSIRALMEFPIPGQDVMEEWAVCQRSWLYLEPIFSSEDIMRQLPAEGKRYQTMDRMWRKIMQSAKQDPKVSCIL